MAKTFQEAIDAGDFLRCTQCNTDLEMAEVDGRDSPVCMKCSRIEYGYGEHEEKFVLALQEDISVENWTISRILNLVRANFKDLARCDQCWRW